MGLLSLFVGASVLAQNLESQDALSTVRFHIKNEYIDKQIDERKLEYGAIHGLLSALNDPYTRFLEPKNYVDMKSRLEGQFFGVGIHMGMRKDTITVISPIAGSPAEKAGLRPMDRILKIDGYSTKGMALEEAVGKVRGPKNTKVLLTIQRGSTENIFEVRLLRTRIHLPAIDRQAVFYGKIGYMHLATFENQNSAKEVADMIKLLEKKKIQALILDLRNNGGGLLRNSISIASMFLENADVVHTVDRNGARTTERTEGEVLYRGPLIVLINEGSASASEILAGAIRDNKRGILVGTTSFGKASVQKILPLPDGAAMLFTIAKYLTPSGVDIGKKGIIPDVVVQAQNSDELALKKGADYRYQDDAQIQKAIQIAFSEIKRQAAKPYQKK